MYIIEYARQTEAHLEALTSRERALVLDAVRIQLRHEPTSVTRNRKRMYPNPIAPWELRVRHLRVYYQVQENPEPVVQILAVGIKRRNQVWIEHKAVQL